MNEIEFNSLDDIYRYGDGWIKKLGHWIADMLDQDKDIVIIIDGQERSGKSSLAYWLGHYISEFTGKEFTMDNWVWNSRFLTELMWDRPKQSVLINDEAGIDKYKLKTMSRENVNSDLAMMVSGLRNQCLIFNVPNLWDLSSYSRDRRVDIWIRVEMLFKGSKIIRGYAQVHSNLTNPKFGLKPWWNPEFELFFRDMPNEFKKRYKTKKEKETRARVDSMLSDDIKPKHKGIDKLDIAKTALLARAKLKRDRGTKKITDVVLCEIGGYSAATLNNAKKELKK